MIDPVQKVTDYRTGYLEGARALLRAIGDDLPEEQGRVLQTWIGGPLEDWRTADAGDAPPPLPLIDGA